MGEFRQASKQLSELLSAKDSTTFFDPLTIGNVAQCPNQSFQINGRKCDPAGGSRFHRLRQDFLDHVAMHIRQPHIPTAEPVSQLCMIDSQQVQHRRMQIMDLDFILDSPVSKLIGGAVGDASFDPSSGHPDRKPERVMIAAV